MSEQRRKITIPHLLGMKERGEKISFLTAYDFPTARLEDEAGIEMILVGDSAAMCMLGHDTTLTITMNEMVTFSRAVTRGARYAFVVGDMPYMSYQPSDRDAVLNAGRLLSDGAVDAVKLEGGERMAPRVRAITEAGIPVMGHIGLTPQAHTQLGGFRSQGRTTDSALQLIRDAVAVEEAGAFSILVEAVPQEIAAAIRERLSIPVLSIGAGGDCDGQLLIVHDLLGLFEAFTPRFVRRYANLSQEMTAAFTRYRDEVRSGHFPGPEHQYPIPAGELEDFRARVGRG
ncbi:MAG: 3-methyl-2-oxobutanoate hydroxymethyltransferase [Gemmatimonadota bacterium]